MISFLKNVRAFLIAIVAVLCLPFSVSSSITYTHILNETDMEIHEITAPDGTIFSRITGEDMFGDGKIGHPEIPYKVIRFLVPDNAYDFSVEIVDAEDINTIELGNKIYPHQLPIPINDYTDEMFSYADDSAYEKTVSAFRAEVLEKFHMVQTFIFIQEGIVPIGNIHLHLFGKFG